MMSEALLSSDRSDGAFQRARDADFLVGLQLWNADDHVRLENPSVDDVDVLALAMARLGLARRVIANANVYVLSVGVQFIQPARATQIDRDGVVLREFFDARLGAEVGPSRLQQPEIVRAWIDPR